MGELEPDEFHAYLNLAENSNRIDCRTFFRHEPSLAEIGLEFPVLIT